YSEEEEAEAMAETIDQYMSKTRTNYGSGVARPKIEEKDSFELKVQFLKELQENTFSGSDNEDVNEHIEKVLEIVDLFHVLNITEDQLMLRVFPISLTGAEVILFYNGLDVPTRQILDSKGVVPTKTAADAKKAIQEMAEYSQKWHNGTFRGRSSETSDGLAAIQAQLNNLGREIKKVNEKVYVAQVGCEQCKGPHYTKDCLLKEKGKTLKEAYYTQFGGPFQGESTKRHEENSNLIKEIRASTDASIRNQGASIKTLEIQIGQMSKVLQERGFGSLPSSTETNLRDQVKSISTTIEADSHPIHRIGSPQYVVSTGQNRTLMYKTRQTTIPFPCRLNGYYCDGKKGSYGPQFLEAYSKASHIDESIPQKEKDPGSFTLPCFINNIYFDNAIVDLGASVNVMPLLTYLNLGLGELAHTKLTVELADRTVKFPKGIAENVLLGKKRLFSKSVKPASSLIKRVYMLSLKEIMELGLEVRLMGETLVINRSLHPLNEYYIELNDLNEPFELRINQGDDLMPTVEEGEVIEEFRTRDGDLDTGIDDYPSYCDDDKEIHIDCAHNLMFSCMIGFEFTYVNFFPLLYINVMSKTFHNSIMKDKMVYKGDNVVGALMNMPIFVGTFSVVTNFTVLEDMDAYRDEGMGDVIVGEPFLREVGIKARWFNGMITIYIGDDEVIYQMMRSHSRFKHHTNEQCNKIPPLLKDDWEVDCYGNANLVIMEYLVNISKRRAFWSLNEDILKINDSDNQYAKVNLDNSTNNVLIPLDSWKSGLLAYKSSLSEYSEEEEAEAMAETMKQYISKTRTDYGSGVVRPTIEEKDSFELKGQFLKELRENTFSGSDNEDANEHIEKVLEIYNTPIFDI
ncbi:hypothetical protein Tco_0981121, partial [Tanacetum coccineum]